MFNALKYTRDLEENGFEREQAEVFIRIFMQMIEFNMVSKSDVGELKSGVRFEMNELKSELKSEMSELRDELRSEMGELRDELRSEMGELRDELRSEMGNFKDELKSEMGELKSELKLDMEKMRSDNNKRFTIVEQSLVSLREEMDLKLAKLSLQLTVKLGILQAVSIGLLSTILAIKL